MNKGMEELREVRMEGGKREKLIKGKGEGREVRLERGREKRGRDE